MCELILIDYATQVVIERRPVALKNHSKIWD